MKQPRIEEAIRRILSRRRANMAGPCPDANELAAFLEAQLTPEETARFEEHAADCSACREALALALKLGAAEESAVTPAAAESRRFTYRTSAMRLVFGAAVVVVVGVLLFQATRQSPQPLQKTQIASKQIPRDISDGAEAAMSSKESKTSPTAAPAASIGRVADNAFRISAQAQGARPVPKPQAVALPTSVPNQPAAETADLTRPQTPAKADAARLAAGEDAKAEMQKKALLNAENIALKMELAAARPAEAKAKTEAVGQPAGQIAQQVTPPVQQAVQINQQAAQVNRQAALDQTQAAMTQAGRGGGVTAQALDEKKRVEPETKTQTDQQAQLAKAAAPAANNRMLALRSMITDSKGSRVSLALEEARPLLAKDQAGKGAKKIGERLWYRTPNYWVDAGCVAHSNAPALEIGRASKEYADILAKEPDLAELHSAGVPILLFWNGSNYLIR